HREWSRRPRRAPPPLRRGQGGVADRGGRQPVGFVSVSAGPDQVTEAPAWFERALAGPYTDEHGEVRGARVHYLAWGRPGQGGLVFVHGGAAHAHWWTHVAAHFARDYRVLALDLSGHGDSDHRDEYPLTGWTDEVIAVADHGGVEGPVVVVGHSMGGFVTIATAALH